MALTNMKFDKEGVVRRSSGYLSGTYTAASVASETTPSATSNSRAVTGAVIGSGVMTLTLGFSPKYFKIINATDRLTQEWFEGLAADNFLETAANGDQTLETDAKLAVSGGTVTITFNGGAVTDNDTAVWFASA